jgi:hypothetical protein
MSNPSHTARGCESIIAIRPEGRGGVILACTLPGDHDGEHQHVGMAEHYPLVENTSFLPVKVRWQR